MRKKGLILTVALVLAMTTLSACGNDNKTEATTQSVEATTEIAQEVNTEKNYEHTCAITSCGKEGLYILTNAKGEENFYCLEHYKENMSTATWVETETTNEDISVAEQTYKDITTATSSDLTYSNGKWYYDGFSLLSDDADIVDSYGQMEAGAPYRKLALVLSGSDFERGQFLYSYSDISPILLGYTPDSKEEYIEVAQKVAEFVVTDDMLTAIMKKFETLDCVNGSFDFDTGRLGAFDFEINDLTECAKEMNISDKMLGYIFGQLDEYAVDLTFDGNACEVSYEW